MTDENSNHQLLLLANQLRNVKDPSWLQLEVCREFQRGQCSRSAQECKFAHPPEYVEVQNGKVTACYDSIKSRCTRDSPKCKYLHPPQHLKDQLLVNGRQNLVLKNLLAAQMSYSPLNLQMMNPSAASLGVLPPGAATLAAFPQNGMTAVTYPFFNAATSPAALNPAGLYTSTGFLPSAASPDLQAMQGMGGFANGVPAPVNLSAPPQAKVRTDRVEVCRQFLRGACQRPETECKFAHPAPEVEVGADGNVIVCMDHMMTRLCHRTPCRYFHPKHQGATAAVPTLNHQAESLLLNGNTSAKSQEEWPLSIDEILAGSMTNANGNSYMFPSSTASLAFAGLPQGPMTFPMAPTPVQMAQTQVSLGQTQLPQPPTIPSMGTTVPPFVGTAASMGGAIPSYGGTVPSLGGTVPSVSGSGLRASRKRPLEPDLSPGPGTSQVAAAAAAAQQQLLLGGGNESLLLAVAALQQQQQQQQQQQTVAAGAAKRVAMDKMGQPVYQPPIMVPATVNNPSIQYSYPYGTPQLIAPALGGYIPVSFAGQPVGMPRY